MHCYDSIVVFDKQKQSRPLSIERPAHLGATAPEAASQVR